MNPLCSPKKKTRRAATLRVFCAVLPFFYFFPLFSHLRIVSNTKFETIPATTEIRNELIVEISPTIFTSFPQLSGRSGSRYYSIIYGEKCQQKGADINPPLKIQYSAKLYGTTIIPNSAFRIHNYILSSACFTSAMISSTFSSPTERRISPPSMPAAASCSSVSCLCVADAG